MKKYFFTTKTNIIFIVFILLAILINVNVSCKQTFTTDTYMGWESHRLVCKSKSEEASKEMYEMEQLRKSLEAVKRPATHVPPEPLPKLEVVLSSTVVASDYTDTDTVGIIIRSGVDDVD